MARITRDLPRRSAPFLALCALVLASLPGRADDTSLFTARIPPNVMFIVDTSGSMNIIAWHPAFHPDAVYDPTNCPFVADPDDPAYDPRCLEFPLCEMPWAWSTLDGGSDDAWSNTDRTFRTLNGRMGMTPPYANCGTRDVYVDPLLQADSIQTRWAYTYLRWYFSPNTEVDHDGNGLTVRQEILASNNGQTSQCLLDENPSLPTTYTKYKRSRIAAARQVLRTVICETALVADLRYGLAKFQAASDPAGGYVVQGIDNYTQTQADAIEADIVDLVGESWTPLSETLFNVYRYFQSRTAGLQAFGKNGTTRFPRYNISLSGSTSSGTFTSQPVTHDCQKHYVILVTDGEPTMDNFANASTSLNGVDSTGFNTLIGDYYLPGDEDETPPNTYWAPNMDATSCGGDCKSSLYLDDITSFMHEKDFALDPAFPGVQIIDTYTVGFTTSVAANALLQRAADVGGGEFFTSNSPEALAEAITDALNSIVSKSKSFTSAAVPASRTTSGDNFYSAFFLPVLDTPFWIGHLKNFDFTGAGEVLTADGKCAIGADPTAVPPCSAVGALRTTANAFWDAADAMPAPASRKLYVDLRPTSPASMFAQPPVFDVPSPATAAVAWFGILATDSAVLPYSTLPPTITTDAMATALIRNLRGCVFGTNCTARVDANGDKIYLGDIFHSNPVVVGSPNAAINENSYRTFANDHRERTRVVYAGANDGFLHAFHAGDWATLEVDGITPLVPPRHDRGTGEELFGFMPYGVRKTIKDFVKFSSGLRTAVNVDGSPIVADVWFNRNVAGSNLTTVAPKAVAKDPSGVQWRTVLLEGLRDGGQHYSALDITDPTADAAESTTTYPRYLWSFPAEDPINSVNGGTVSETGYVTNTWSEPVITRVRVRVDDAADRYERWVAIFGAGYHLEGDPNGTGYVANSSKGRAIYMVDINTGRVLAKKAFHPSTLLPYPPTSLSLATTEQVTMREMQYAIASAPAVFDLDFDGFADVIYIGDLGGNLWKWVVSAPGDDPISGVSPYNSLAQPQWPFRLFFRGSASTEPPPELAPTYGAWNNTVHYQSFFFPPTGALRNGELVLAWGGGERAEPIGTAAEWSDGLLSNNNHYYVVKDADPLERVGTLPNRFTGKLTENDLADFDAVSPLTCAQMKATKQGYFLTGRDSEKFISNSTIFLGTLFTGSFLPANPALSNCDGKGTAFLYAFDLECGVGEFQSNPGSEADKRRMAIGTGLPTRPRVSVGDLNQGDPSGCVNKVVVVTSDGEIWNDCPGSLPSSGVQVRSWRER